MKQQDSSTVAAGQPNTQPLALRLLAQYGISKRGIGRQLNMSPDRINRALDMDSFHEVRIRDVSRVRAQVERLVRAAGWEGSSDQLWAEYDEQLKNVA